VKVGAARSARAEAVLAKERRRRYRAPPERLRDDGAPPMGVERTSALMARSCRTLTPRSANWYTLWALASKDPSSEGAWGDGPSRSLTSMADIGSAIAAGAPGSSSRRPMRLCSCADYVELNRLSTWRPSGLQHRTGTHSFRTSPSPGHTPSAWRAGGRSRQRFHPGFHRTYTTEADTGRSVG
jgi:hypothetical protein